MIFVVVVFGLHVTCLVSYVSVLAFSLVHAFCFTHAPIDFDFFVDDHDEDDDDDGNRSVAVVGVGENGCRGKHVVETYVGFTYIYIYIYCEIGLISVFAAWFFLLSSINDANVCTIWSCNSYSIVRV